MALEKFTYDNSLAKSFAVATIVWGVVAFLVGLIAAFAILLIPYIPYHRLNI